MLHMHKNKRMNKVQVVNDCAGLKVVLSSLSGTKSVTPVQMLTPSPWTFSSYESQSKVLHSMGADTQAVVRLATQ